MKVYLEEKDMPRDCASCRYYSMNCADGYSCSKLNGREVHCNFSEGMGYRHKDCPLQSIADYTKQVRKEVVEFIDKCFEMQKYESIWINPDKTEFSCDVSYAYEWWESFRKTLLDQTQGEDNGII